METQRTYSVNSGRYAGNAVRAVYGGSAPGECMCHQVILKLYLDSLRTGDRLLARHILLLLVRIPDRISLN